MNGEIDRLGWAAETAFVSNGLRIGIRASSPEIMDRIAGVLPPHVKPARGGRVGRLYLLIASGTKVGSNVRRFNILYADAIRAVRTKDTDVVLETLERDLQLYVAEQARRRVFVHAGVVGWCGKAIVIPERTMSGKTTLVRQRSLRAVGGSGTTPVAIPDRVPRSGRVASREGRNTS